MWGHDTGSQIKASLTPAQELAAARERAEEAAQRAARAEAASAAAAGQLQTARQELARCEQQQVAAQLSAQVALCTLLPFTSSLLSLTALE